MLGIRIKKKLVKEPQYRKTGKKLKNENLLMKGSVGGRGGAKSCVTELDANFGPTPGQIHLSDIERGCEVSKLIFRCASIS